MSDIFQEVEEEVRRERFEQLWKQYGDYVIAGVALIFIALSGYLLWDKYQNNERLKASETLIAAQELADSGDFTRANPAFATVAKDAPGGYAEMARLSEAGTLLRAGRRPEAIQLYKSIAAKDSGPIGAVALIRAGWAMAGNASRDDVANLLAPLTTPTSAWRHSAGEIIAYADYHAGQILRAQAEFQAIADDKDATDAMRRRADAMAKFLKQGGFANFGTVPPPPAPAGLPSPAVETPPGTPPK
ncbi:MAG: tetratricopeptide repeat protein [Rhizomicrobium sp.]